MLAGLEKSDDFLELVFCLVDAGDVLESHFRIGLDIDLGFAAADRHEAAAEALLIDHAADHEEPDANEQQRRQCPR